MAMGIKHPEDDVPPPPAPAFGDSIGAMTIAGGIMGALFHRANTGEATVVDVSLLGIGIWSIGAALALSLQHQFPWAPPPRGQSTGNPLSATYRTSDGKYVALTCLQAVRYWPELCALVDRPELASDERFIDAPSIKENAQVATDLLTGIFAERTADAWRALLDGFSGQWTMVQDTLEVVQDPQTVANGYIVDCETAEGLPFQLAGAPIQFGEAPPSTRRAPEFNEHGDAILESIGLDQDAIIDLKVRGVVA
jgi:crotonobetainyl-CoA:carnitine CoA-transferase CaiB-like acyl-CoA transferase